MELAKRNVPTSENMNELLKNLKDLSIPYCYHFVLAINHGVYTNKHVSVCYVPQMCIYFE